MKFKHFLNEQEKEQEQELVEAAVTKAFFYAKDAHKGQTRSDGSRYIKHPVRVANIVKKYKTSKNLNDILAAAYLHDTIEDTKTTENDIKQLFGGLVSSLVKELTSDKDKIKEVGKTQYLVDKMTNMSSWALVIKLADRLDNVSDLRTAKSVAWRQKYKKETEEILHRLQMNRELSATHKTIIAEIKKKLDDLSEETVTGLVAGVRSSDEPPVKKFKKKSELIKKMLTRTKPVDITK